MTGRFFEKYFLAFAASLYFLLCWYSPVHAERPFPKPKGLVNDFANVIPAAQEQKI